MTPELAKKWSAALRSGKYKQGKYSLYKRGKHCCLGVLYKVAFDKEAPDPFSEEGAIHAAYGQIGQLLGIRLREFTKMNDHQGKTFEEIADYIDATYGG